ncbi:MAG: hypothetical protein VXY27_04890, partial [Thermoproteota archaeon]|nr:hypothetical protein [Thermoproteota archaeon]
ETGAFKSPAELFLKVDFAYKIGILYVNSLHTGEPSFSENPVEKYVLNVRCPCSGERYPGFLIE